MGGTDVMGGGMPPGSEGFFTAMLENPQFLESMQQFASSPHFMELINNHPMFQQMIQANPAFATMLQNPDFRRTMFDPNTMRLMTQMYRAKYDSRAFSCLLVYSAPLTTYLLTALRLLLPPPPRLELELEQQAQPPIHSACSAVWEVLEVWVAWEVLEVLVAWEDLEAWEALERLLLPPLHKSPLLVRFVTCSLRAFD